MRMLTVRLARKVADVTEKLVLQIVGSIAATVCVAMITNAYLSNPAPSRTIPTSFNTDAASAAGLFDANFVADTFRRPVASPVEFGAVFGPAAEGPLASLAGDDWPSDALTSVKQEKAQPKIRTTLAACSSDCGRVSTVQVLPPVRPATERAIEPVPQAVVFAPEEQPEQHLEILGISLPKFVPTGEKIVSTVSAWGSSLTDIVLR